AKLRDSREMLETFLEGIEPMREKLGCVLVQMPPTFAPETDETALRQFVMALPKRFRFALEFRHPGWHMPRIIQFLQENGVAWVWTDVSSLDDQNEGPFEFVPLTA